MPDSITITRPDDWHLHLRDGGIMARVAPMTARQFGRALIMPNLSPPVVSVSQALEYRERILATLPGDARFDPKMSIYLTDNTPVSEVKAAADSPHVLGFKLYPAGATTHSDAGVTRINAVMPVLESMAEHSVVLQIHGEVTDPHVDVFDREAVFIEQVLVPLHRELPELKMVLEHVTTTEGVEFVMATSHRVAATITPQHLLYDRNELFRGGIRPHAYCLPVPKRASHRDSVLAAATGGDPSFFLGTDSAPHARHDKESGCGCAGVFSAFSAMEIYAGLFDAMDCLDRLESFAGHFGADYYGLPRNPDSLTLARKPLAVPDQLVFDDLELVPLRAGESLAWSAGD